LARHILIGSESVSTRLRKSEILEDLDSKLEHLDSLERKQLKQLIDEYKHLFPDIPTQIRKIYYDVDEGHASKSNFVTYLARPILFIQSSIRGIGNESYFVKLLTFLLYVHILKVLSGFGTNMHGELQLLWTK
jgi:hypothetical protein